MTDAPHLSVSQVKLADKCSLAWHYRYVDELPAPEEAASKVFGTVVHNGVENWYGDPGSDNHQKQELRSYVHDQWFEYLPQEVAIELRHCIAAERELAELEQLVRISRPKIKSPRTTVDFLKSPQFKHFEDARDGLLAASTKCEDMRWPQTENAFQAYMKSLFIANQLQERWRHFPRPLVIEREFTIELAGIEVRGRIDQIRNDPDPQGEVKTEGLDLKTGRQLMTQMDAFLQAFLYNEACHLDPGLPVPDFWTFWMARHNKPQRGEIDRERHTKIAERILTRVRRQIASGDYAPHYGMWCKSCDYAGICEAEISMWPPGQDSLVLDLERVAA